MERRKQKTRELIKVLRIDEALPNNTIVTVTVVLRTSCKRTRICFVLYNDQPMHNYFTKYHTPTCFDTIVSSSGSS